MLLKFRILLAFLTHLSQQSCYQYPLVFSSPSPAKDQRYNCMDYDGSDFVYIGGSVAGTTIIGSNTDTAFVFKYSTTTQTIDKKVTIGSYTYTFACKLSNSKLVVATNSDFSIGVLDPSTFDMEAYYELTSTSTNIWVQPEIYYKDSYLYGAFFDSSDSNLRVFSILTTTHAYVFKTVPVTIQKSYAIAAINDYIFVPAISATSSATAYQFSFSYSNANLIYGYSYSSISGSGLELDAVAIVEGTTESAFSFCGPKNTDKKLWMVWGKWNVAANVATIQPDSHMVVEITPDSGFDSACMAVSINSADVEQVYYAVSVAKNDADTSWDFYVIYNDFASGSSTIKEVLNNDILQLDRGDYVNIKGGMQYGSTVDQFFFLGSTLTTLTTSSTKLMGFLFSTDFVTSICSTSTASMGSYGSVSYSYSDIAFSNAGLSLTTDARIFSSLSSVSIVDWLADYPGVNCETETATFGVTVDTVITLDAPTDFPTTWAYTVNQGVDSLAFDVYTCSSTCGTITYTAYLFGETDFGDLSLYLSFDDTNRQLNMINVPSNLLAGSYSIVIEATEDQDATVNSAQTIDLTIASFDPITLNDLTMDDITVIIQLGVDSYQFDEYTATTYTGSDLAITYAATFDDDSAIDSSTPINGITFDPATRTFTFDPTSASGTSVLKVWAYPTTTTTADTVHVQSFSLTYLSVELDPPADLSAIETVTYYVLDGSQDYSFGDYTSTQTIGTLSYQAELEDGSALPSCISFDGSLKQFTVDSQTNADLGTYSIRIIATEDLNGISNEDELISITIEPAELSAYVSLTEVNSIYFEVWIDSEKEQTFVETISSSYEDTYSISYTLLDADTLLSPPTFITLSGYTISVTGADEADEGTYDLAIQATDAITGEVLTPIATFSVYVTLPETNYAPSWGATFSDQELSELEEILFILPYYEDANVDDSHTFTMETDAGFVTLDSDLRSIFIEPQLGDAGSYSVTIVITDDNFRSTLSDSGTFQIEVVALVEETTTTTATTEEGSASTGANQAAVDYSAFERQDMPAPTAKITKVDNYGVLKIEFSQKMLIPGNITAIGEESLRFKVYTKSEQFDADTVILGWEVIQFSEKYMYVQLDFDNPMLISSTSEMDLIQLEFLDSGAFISSESFKRVNSGTSDVLRREMPMQMKESSAMASLDAVSASIEQGSAAIGLVTFFVQLLLSGSLALLWGMVNTLQIIVHMPLMNVSMPPNVSTLTSALVSLASFDFLPMDKINKVVFGIEPEPEKKARYQAVGMESSNFIMNCAQMLFAFFAWFGFVSLHKLCKLLTRVFPKMQALEQKLAQKIYYGVLIVLCLESYLEVLISSFVQVKVVSWSSMSSSASSIAAILFCVFFILLPFGTFGVLKLSARILSKKETIQKLGALFNQFKLNQQSARMFNFFFLVRRLFYAAALVFSSEFVFLQLTIVNIGSFLIIQYVINKWPYKHEYMNRLELANESIILALTYLMWALSDYQGYVGMKLQIGWVYCGVIALCICINFGVMLYFAVWVPIQKKCKKKKEQKKARQTQKYEQDLSSSPLELPEKKANLIKFNQPNFSQNTFVPLKSRSLSKAQVQVGHLRSDTGVDLLNQAHSNQPSSFQKEPARSRVDSLEQELEVQEANPQDSGKVQPLAPHGFSPHLVSFSSIRKASIPEIDQRRRNLKALSFHPPTQTIEQRIQSLEPSRGTPASGNRVTALFQQYKLKPASRFQTMSYV